MEVGQMSAETETESERNEYGVIEVPPGNVRTDDEGEETPERFQQDRKEWATALDAEADRYYQEFFDVSEHAIYSFESCFEGEYDVGDAERSLQLLDFAGLDRLVDVQGQRIVPIAQRWRPASGGRDFSFRVTNGKGKDAERDKCLNAFRDGGFYPAVYAFGVVAESEESFEEFHLLDTRKFLMAIETETIRGEGPYPSPDGKTEALYYSVEALREAGCVLQSWGESA